MIRAEIVEAILNERHRQKTEGYADALDAYEWVAVLCEEMGELSQAVVDWQRSRADPMEKRRLREASIAEAIQLAAACVAFAEDWS